MHSPVPPTSIVYINLRRRDIFVEEEKKNRDAAIKIFESPSPK
jgi:hypothetical protein